MTSVICRLSLKSAPLSLCRAFSVSSVYNKEYSCKLLILGGGSGGCTIANKFANKLPQDSIIVLEPSTDHYYQPLWTLVGAGEKKLYDTRRREKDVLPESVRWIRESATFIDPSACKVTTDSGDVINYEYAVISVGLKNDYHKVPGLTEALEMPESFVNTIYSLHYCEKTFADMSRFVGGNAIFTYPNSVIKCPGAPQKIAYLADSYWSTVSTVRYKTDMFYYTCQPSIFGVPKYAKQLVKVAAKKKIHVGYKTILTQIFPDKMEAEFVVDNTKKMVVPYKFLHVTPPMSPPDFLRNCDITDTEGYVDVDKFTLQHKKHSNVFGIGDCTNTPNSKTAAAVARQSYVLEQNLLAVMNNGSVKAKYDGYGGCPLLTSYNSCIMAEFLYDGKVHETFPFDQSKESKLAYYMKRDIFPFIYWNYMLKGKWHGPGSIRKIINPMGL